MVPAAFVVLPALPLTGSGKIDHRALPEPDWGAATGQVPVAPRTPTESRLAAIVAELLALPAPVGVSDNFFALGGHSLTATRLMARIRAVYGVDLPIRTLFSDPTVAGLAAALAAAGSGAADPPRRRGRRRPIPAARRPAMCRGRSYPATGGRSPCASRCRSRSSGCGSSISSRPASRRTTCPMRYGSTARSTRSALQRAMDAMVARHAVLRTSIVAFDGVPEQVVADTGAVPIERIELPAGLDDGERTRQAESIAADLARQPFDLATGPLIRAALIAAGPDRHLFVLVMHHIISDGVSMEILIAELSAVYRAETTGVPASLPPLWMEYGDYAVWQQDRMRGEELDRQLGYWREQLRGAPQVLTLPADRPRPARPVLARRGGGGHRRRRDDPAPGRGGPGAPTPPCSWCSSPASWRCCRATRARPTS